MGTERPIAIGRIDYTNVWPIFDRFDEVGAGAALPPYRIRRSVPSELNRALHAGEIDLAGISSFAFGEQSEDLLLLPDLSVSADGDVRSVLLFLKRPLEEALDGTIAVTTTSATSVNLLKIILQGRYGATPRYVAMEPNLDAMLAAADAALLIGDTAIRASWRADHGCEVLDVSRLWKDWTGLGMTFAVFAVRAETARRSPQAVAQVHKALLASKRLGESDIGRLAVKAVRAIGGDEAYWNRYFRGLRHGFGPGERAGLSLYFDYARRFKLLDKEVKLQYWSDQSVAQVNE